MCFSASASFVAGGALSVLGVAALVHSKAKKNVLLASIPLLFGIQQLIDGLVWLSFSLPVLHTVAVFAYVFFAQVFWPIFIPIAVLLSEQNNARKMLLRMLAFVGASVGIFFSYYLLYGNVTAQIVNHCVAYDTHHAYRFTVLAFYIIAVCGAFFVSSQRFLRIFGFLVLASFFISGWLYLETFSSTWCFFAAILSALLYKYVTK